MLRTVISFAAGFVIAKVFDGNKTAEKIKRTSSKVVKTIKEEFSSKNEENEENEENEAEASY